MNKLKVSLILALSSSFLIAAFILISLVFRKDIGSAFNALNFSFKGVIYLPLIAFLALIIPQKLLPVFLVAYVVSTIFLMANGIETILLL